MIIAFAYWEERIAPVFDSARKLHLLTIENDQIVAESRETLPDDLPMQKAAHLSALGVNKLVCGAISRPLFEMIISRGIEVIPFIAGELTDIVQAFRDKKLADDRYAMPGCCGRRSGRGHGRGMGLGMGRGAGLGRGVGRCIFGDVPDGGTDSQNTGGGMGRSGGPGRRNTR